MIKIYLIGVSLNEDGANPVRSLYQFKEGSVADAREIARGLLNNYVDDGYCVIVEGEYQEILGNVEDYNDEIALMMELIDKENISSKMVAKD